MILRGSGLFAGGGTRTSTTRCGTRELVHSLVYVLLELLPPILSYNVSLLLGLPPVNKQSCKGQSYRSLPHTPNIEWKSLQAKFESKKERVLLVCLCCGVRKGGREAKEGRKAALVGSRLPPHSSALGNPGIVRAAYCSIFWRGYGCGKIAAAESRECLGGGCGCRWVWHD